MIINQTQICVLWLGLLFNKGLFIGKLYQMTKTFKTKQLMTPIFLHIVNMTKLVISDGYETVIIELSEDYHTVIIRLSEDDHF